MSDLKSFSDRESLSNEKVKREETTVILIEPVFENKDLINVMPELKNMAYHLITQSSVLSSFSIRVEHRMGKLINKVKLKNVKLTDKRSYEQTFREEPEVELNKPKDSKLVGSFNTVFPTPGIWWLELEIAQPNIETQQRLLHGEIGQGWSEHEKDSDGVPKKNFLRHPILVLDSIGINQIKLNKRLECLTWIIVGLALIPIILEIIRRFWNG